MTRRSLPVAQQKERRLRWRAWKDGQGLGAPDDSLTNLQWLQEFSFLPTGPETSSASGLLGPSGVLLGACGPASPPAGDTAAKGMPPSMGRPTSSVTSSRHSPAPADPRSDARAKPPYSYATLICMAMRASQGAQLTLSAIYAWIMENFAYYRHAEPSWQNSVRHNLSLNKCFQKVPRGKDQPGKGGFWRIDPRYAETLVSGGFPRKRMPALPSPAANTRPRSCWRERGGRPLGAKGKQPPAPQAGKEPGTVEWPLSLGETLDAAASEALELKAALSALVPAEDLPALSPPLSALSKRGPSPPPSPPPMTPPADTDALVLRPEPLTEPWEEVGEEPMLGAGWGLLEEDPCFGQDFLAEMQPWEG